mmetsp:Transcript_35644/g.57312  ORF Transcript_35644/g.57312 Transcript_35644/m.57312 type:complete len:163 (-) Transcript_35644:57-545(-)
MFTMRRLVLPTVALLAGKASLSAAMSEPGAPKATPGITEMHEKLMESVEYSQAVSTMSEIMAQAESEARDFVEQKAAELGEDGAFDAALMEAFVAFDSDDDGKLIGQEAAVLLEVSGRSLPAELQKELEDKDFECTFEEFVQIYARTTRNEDVQDEDEDSEF